jgi:hypothetical protein
MMAERGIVVSHTTIMHWVLHYLPEYERRWARFARSPGSSWRMDETAVAVRGGRHYLYRAVDRRGKSVASLLCDDRSKEAEVGRMAAAAHVRAVLLTHLVSSLDNDDAMTDVSAFTAGVRKAYSGPVMVGRDVFEYDLVKPGPATTK